MGTTLVPRPFPACMTRGAAIRIAFVFLTAGVRGGRRADLLRAVETLAWAVRAGLPAWRHQERFMFAAGGPLFVGAR